VALSISATGLLALSSAGWATIAALGGAAIGGVIAFCATLFGLHGERQERRRQERVDAYVALIVAVNDVSHEIGNLTEREAWPSDDERLKTSYRYDREVTPKLRVVELVRAC
jgi:hypothetical protein